MKKIWILVLVIWIGLGANCLAYEANWKPYQERGKQMVIFKQEVDGPRVELYLDNKGVFRIKLYKCTITEAADMFINEVIEKWETRRKEKAKEKFKDNKPMYLGDDVNIEWDKEVSKSE